eukprot:snap_masked-scaffold_2-processed-gene-22.3-mRNA-1 protein AED:1.00 eAED:1.00 QI:0/0/0/0/1/1/2/0/92
MPSIDFLVLETKDLITIFQEVEKIIEHNVSVEEALAPRCHQHELCTVVVIKVFQVFWLLQNCEKERLKLNQEENLSEQTPWDEIMIYKYYLS